jgi:hypothetical protein
MMTHVLAIVALAVLATAFGLIYRHRGCGSCGESGAGCGGCARRGGPGETDHE